MTRKKIAPRYRGTILWKSINVFFMRSFDTDFDIQFAYRPRFRGPVYSAISYTDRLQTLDLAQRSRNHQIYPRITKRYQNLLIIYMPCGNISPYLMKLVPEQ